MAYRQLYSYKAATHLPSPTLQPCPLSSFPSGHPPAVGGRPSFALGIGAAPASRPTPAKYWLVKGHIQAFHASRIAFKHPFIPAESKPLLIYNFLGQRVYRLVLKVCEPVLFIRFISNRLYCLYDYSMPCYFIWVNSFVLL